MREVHSREEKYEDDIRQTHQSSLGPQISGVIITDRQYRQIGDLKNGLIVFSPGSAQSRM